MGVGLTSHFGDRLASAIREKAAPACVGFDPLPDRLPAELKGEAAGGPAQIAAAITTFGRGVIDAVASIVPVIKINIAFFEPYHEHGLTAYSQLVRYAHQAGLIVIGDVKRADIGHTSGLYASAHLAPTSGDSDLTAAIVDAITVNPYFGSEGVSPFVEVAAKHGRGVFVLVQTSNESASQVQGLTLPDGLTVCQRVAQLVQSWASAKGLIGTSGYSCVGAVVSPRDLKSTELIREMMPNCLFLVPGFGAQGRTADEVAKCFKPDGSGALVTASRSVIFAYNDPKYAGRPWRDAIREACQEFVGNVRASVSPGSAA